MEALCCAHANGETAVQVGLDPAPPGLEMFGCQVIRQGLLRWPHFVKDVGAWMFNIAVAGIARYPIFLPCHACQVQCQLFKVPLLLVVQVEAHAPNYSHLRPLCRLRWV